LKRALRPAAAAALWLRAVVPIARARTKRSGTSNPIASIEWQGRLWPIGQPDF